MTGTALSGDKKQHLNKTEEAESSSKQRGKTHTTKRSWKQSPYLVDLPYVWILYPDLCE